MSDFHLVRSGGPAARFDQRNIARWESYLKVLIVSHSYAVAENQKNIEALKHHVDVRVVLPGHVSDRVFGKVITVAKDSEIFKIFRRLSFPRSQYLVASLDFGMRDFKPDIVHIEYDPWSLIFCQTILLRRLFAPSSRVICTVKKNTYRPIREPIQSLKIALGRFFAGKVSHFVAINQGAQRIYTNIFGVADARISIMQHLGIDSTVFLPAHKELSAGEVTVGYCGRLDRNKGVDDLIVAVEIARAIGNRQLRLLLLGDGELRQSTLARGKDWIEVLDPMPHAEVAQFMQRLDLFVLPALVTPDHEEHDGHALMEAMACGVASIGSRSGVIPELLAGECGLLFDSGDRDQLAECLRRLSEDLPLRQEIAKRAAAKAVSQYSIEAIAIQKLDIYRRFSQ